MKPTRMIAAGGLCAAVLVQPLSAQEIPPDTPGPVVRRIAQAIWPENLFDSTGHPEPALTQLGLRPDFTDLKIQRRGGLPERFAAVTLYAGSAYPRGCWHCGTRRKAVAQRDSVFITLLEADEIEQILPWARPAFSMADSVELRQALVALLDASCLLGCGVKQAHDPNDVPYPELWISTDPGIKQWAMPRTYSHVSSASLTLEFPVLARSGLFRVYATRDWRGNYNVSITPVARPMLEG